MGLKLSGRHQLLAYADDVNLLGDDMDNINKNKQKENFVAFSPQENYTSE
jgi:hypothetical protein